MSFLIYFTISRTNINHGSTILLHPSWTAPLAIDTSAIRYTTTLLSSTHFHLFLTLAISLTSRPEIGCPTCRARPPGWSFQASKLTFLDKYNEDHYIRPEIFCFLRKTSYALLASSSGLTIKALITIFIAYFLRSSRSQMPGRENYIRQLKKVFMEMGLMTCIIHILVVITLSLPNLKARRRWALAPGSLLTKSYFNSNLAVLNTRKAIRQRQDEALGQMYELGTLRNSIASVH
ncbi:hypothetical protein AZE42_11958 [Rhizopogon vesiculosus]|uniref:DUF6534 domain-containing protein n=1 Tax=Rhizopogon vesiculosus TaxID=180088 RepID=A0A1J8PQ63_9AGAM|nr:hypothetical protein AZE42_11958 [Rhizopogon vesiculosus]